MVDRAVLREPARAEMEGRDADRVRSQTAHVGGSRREDLADERRLRQRPLIGVAALRAHPARVGRGGRAVGDGRLGTPPSLGGVDA